MNIHEQKTMILSLEIIILLVGASALNQRSSQAQLQEEKKRVWEAQPNTVG